MCQQAQHICPQKPSGEQCAGCTVACDGMFLWCVQEVAELKEEVDIIICSHTATATQLPTAAAGVSGCLSRTLNELLCRGRSHGHTVVCSCVCVFAMRISATTCN